MNTITKSTMKIVLTGGGTAGHVTPNIALLPELRARGFDIYYIGSKGGMEQALVEGAGVPYHGISSGKLRRYLSIKNVTDGFRVLRGISEARKILKKIRPDVVFSKGGFVVVPVVLAARMLKIPVVIHESDFSVGLANRLAIPRANKVCCVFPETLKQIPAGKAVLTGTPIRKEILSGSRLAGAAACGFAVEKPVVLVMGGSQGAAAINTRLRDGLDELLPDFNIVHGCGKGNVDEAASREGYLQFEYIDGNMGDIYALSDLVVCRAGSNSISEFLALAKPNLLIPLPKAVSRGDQILNAASFEKQGFSAVLDEAAMTKETLIAKIREVYAERGKYAATMRKSGNVDGTAQVVEVILGVKE